MFLVGDDVMSTNSLATLLPTEMTWIGRTDLVCRKLMFDCHKPTLVCDNRDLVCRKQGLLLDADEGQGAAQSSFS
jgi:hypothetical protein